MRTRNRYCVKSSKELISLLDQLKIPYKVFIDMTLIFYLYKDDPLVDKIDAYITGCALIIPELLFSKAEYENATWYRFMPKCDKIPSSDSNLTYSYFCTKEDGMVDYDSTHQRQIGYYRPEKKPRLPQNDKCIMSSEGNYDHMWFVNDVTRDFLECSDIHGIRFDPVLGKRNGQPFPNIHQIVFENIIPEEAIVLGKEYGVTSVVPCDSCHEKRYYVSPQTYQLYLYDKYIGDSDLYITEATFGQGYGYRIVMGSKKFYHLIKQNNMTRFFRIHPVKIERENP